MYMRERFHDVLPPMPEAVSIDVTQAAQWWLRDDERTDYPWSAYSCVVPPYESLWMEFVYPSQVRDRGVMRDVPRFLFGLGLHLRSIEIDDETAESIRGHHNEFLSTAISQYLPRTPMKHHGKLDDSDTAARWLVIGHSFMSSRNRVLPSNLWAMTLDTNGKFACVVSVPLPWTIMALAAGLSIETAREMFFALPEQQKATAMDAMRTGEEQPFMFCLALIHCRNVEVVDRPAPPAPILKQRAKKGIPYIQYKTLEVMPLRKVYQNGQRKNGEPEPKALHFVRGHFKDFTAKGLFGKYKGVYWWDSAVRGDVAKGIIDKDYKVSHD